MGRSGISKSVALDLRWSREAHFLRVWVSILSLPPGPIPFPNDSHFIQMSEIEKHKNQHPWDGTLERSPESLDYRNRKPDSCRFQTCSMGAPERPRRHGNTTLHWVRWLTNVCRYSRAPKHLLYRYPRWG